MGCTCTVLTIVQVVTELQTKCRIVEPVIMTKSVDATLATIRLRIKSVHVSIGNASTSTSMTGYAIPADVWSRGMSVH